MTKYVYKGKEILHTELLSLMRKSGIGSGYRVSHYEHLKALASEGNVSAVAILKDLHVFTEPVTFDVVFNDNNDSNSKGFQDTAAYCYMYIQRYNGTNESYFKDYKGGTVQVVCNETGEVVYEEEVR